MREKDGRKTKTYLLILPYIRWWRTAPVVVAIATSIDSVLQRGFSPTSVHQRCLITSASDRAVKCADDVKRRRRPRASTFEEPPVSDRRRKTRGAQKWTLRH